MTTVNRKGQGTRTWTMETVRGRCTEDDRCLIWNQGVNSGGYPVTSINGKPGTSVRKFIFTELLGRTVPNGKRITSRCDNRRCCSEHCLMAQAIGTIIKRGYEKRCMTPAGLALLQERCPFSKLDREKARQIRTSTESTKVIAARYGISAASASAIRRGEAWREPPVLVSSIFALATSMGVA